ncbi:hypothetical protein BH09GEM1_BH09GEM1_16080 [soil metagenome]
MIATVVLLCAVVPLLPTLRAAFIYDDTTIIRDNPVLRGWGSLMAVWSKPYWSGDGGEALGLYRPIQQALLALVWNIGKGSALLFHTYALLLAAATSIAVWWTLRRAVGGMPALAAAAWFATHPLHVEAVASVANTSELTVALCTMGLAWLLGQRVPHDGAKGGRIGRTIALAVLAAAAIGAKESGLLAIPVAVLTAWGWRRSTAGGPSLMDLTWANARELIAAVASVAGVLLARLAVLGAPVSTSNIAAQGLASLSAPERVLTMMSLWPKIAWMLLLPSSPSPYYGPTIIPEHTGGLAALSLAVAISLTGLAVVLARRGDRRPLVAVGWIVLTYLPASNLLTATGQLLSDRALFGATIGAALAIAWALDCIPPFGRRVAAVLLMLLSARNALGSAHYAVAWTSHRTLWTRMIEVAPEEHLGYKLLGMDARARGDTAQAISLLERAFAMAPSDRQTRFELGQAQYATGRYRAAAATLSPLMLNTDARGERDFVALYLDAVGRSAGPAAVVTAATPLVHSPSAPVAELFIGIAQEQMGNRTAAESAYVAGLRRSAGDSALLARYLALHPEHMHH